MKVGFLTVRLGKLTSRVITHAADEAADFGRRKVGNAVVDTRRDLSGVFWSPVPCYS